MKSYARAATAQSPHQRVFSFSMAILLVASFFSATIAMSGGIARASAQTSSGLADVVPAASVMYTEVTLDQASEQWTKTYELLERAGLSDLSEDELDASPEQIGQLAETFEMTGNAAIAFTSADAFSSETVGEFSNEAMDISSNPSSIASTDVPEGFVVVFQPDDPEALYQMFQGIVADEAQESGAEVETVDYNGTTIEFWTPVDSANEPTATALIDNTVVLAVRPDDIEPVIDTMSGTLDALSSNENFTAVRDAFTTPSLNFGYVDGSAILSQAAAEEPELAQYTASYNSYFGWNTYADDSGFHLDTVAVPAEGATAHAMAPFDPTLAQQVSGDALYFLNGNDLAGTGIFDLFGFVLQSSMADSSSSSMDASPVSTPTADDIYAQLEAQLGFNIKTDLFDQLNGEYALAVNFNDIFSNDPVTDLVFVSDVADETTVSDVTTKITYILNAAVGDEATIAERQVNGGAVTSIEIPSDSTSGFPVTIEYGVVGGQLLIGVNNGIDSYLDGSAVTLADDATYQQTMSALPQDNIVGIQYLSLEKLLPMIEDAATSLSTSTATLDNDLACGDYTTQQEAQAAYDADETGLWNLDLDYDGQACEDYFESAASPEASPENVSGQLNLLSIGTVSHMDGDMYRSSTVLLIGE